jgi:hypothetical protein
MTEEELRFRKIQLDIRVNEYHALRHVYLIEFPYPEWQTPWGTILAFAFVVSKATNRVMSAPPNQTWMKGKDVGDVKKWVWSYMGTISCDTDPELQTPASRTGMRQRIPIKRLVYRVLPEPLNA